MSKKSRVTMLHLKNLDNLLQLRVNKQQKYNERKMTGALK